MIAGVVLDSWKLPIFKKHLDTAGYTYTEHPGLTPDSTLLKVTCDYAYQLMPIVKAAAYEAAKEKKS